MSVGSVRMLTFSRRSAAKSRGATSAGFVRMLTFSVATALVVPATTSARADGNVGASRRAPPPAAPHDTPVFTGAAPPLSSLPVGRFPSMPRGKTPAWIAAREKVAGFVITPPPPEQAKAMRGATGIAYLFGTAKRARGFLAEQDEPDEPDRATCFVDGDSVSHESDSEASEHSSTPPVPVDWPAQASAMMPMSFDVHQSAVRPVHSERFVDGPGDRASLETTDVWLDARSRGVRLIGRTRLPLARVYAGPNDLRVYAARDGANLVVVVRAPRSPIDAPGMGARFASELGSLGAILPAGTSGSSDCGHLRFVLHPKPGQGEMATLQSIALLPPLDGDGVVIPDGEEPSPESLAEMRLTAMRRRAFQLSVSASQTTSDADPVLSVAVGWVGREKRGGT
jgi:hypothetical protein